MYHKPVSAALGLVTLLVAATASADAFDPNRISTHMGEMTSEISAPDDVSDIRDTLRFEPWQMIDEMFFRNDVVFLMRHGPTNWDLRDKKDVAPTDCENQRVMDQGGMIAMQNLGILLASNEVLPGKVLVSQWCRNQQTVENLVAGMSQVNAEYAAGLEVETDPSLNLLLSLQGAASVKEMRETVSNWTGEGYDGPLLMISHYTNIEEMTDFRVFEGEMLIIDPKRENRVLGYLRLRSSTADVGHFNVQ